MTTARKPSVLLDALAVIAEKGDAVESLARDAYEVSFSSRRVGDEKVRGGYTPDSTGERASCECGGMILNTKTARRRWSAAMTRRREANRVGLEMKLPEESSHPFTARVRLILLVASVGLLAVGAAAVFITDSDAGAAAFITLGTGMGLLALVGPYVEAFKLGGVEASFRAKDAEKALQDAIDEAAQSTGLSISPTDKSGALRRAESHIAFLREADVLWVDDDPGGNDAERRMLTALGVSVDIALSNDEAILKLRRRRFDCVISDIGRPAGEPTGLELRDRMERSASEKQSVYRWLIYYVLELERDKDTPRGALGITNRPDHLLHYVLDAVEREAFEKRAHA